MRLEYIPSFPDRGVRQRAIIALGKARCSGIEPKIYQQIRNPWV